MKVTLNITCHIANNANHQIIFDINDEVLKEHDTSDSDELVDLLYSTIEQWYEYDEETWENLGGKK